MVNTAFQYVTVDLSEGIARVTINRPEKRNALNRATLEELRQAFGLVARDASLQLAVLSGAGDKSFAAGGDLREFDAIRSPDDARHLFNHAAAALDAVWASPVPVIAALNGTALGGGAELAMACDYRVAAGHARIGFVQSTLAITTGFGGGERLVAALGSAAAMRLLAQGEVLSADAARQLGLVDDVVSDGETLDARVMRFAQPFLSRPPHVVRAIKQMACANRAVRSLREDTQVMRDAERDSFVSTWTNEAHWAAVDQWLAAQQSKRGAQ